jgi:zinc/manganese transport system substrate-binding protein
MKKPVSRLLVGLALIVSGALLFGLAVNFFQNQGSEPTQTATPTGPIKVVASTNVYGSIAKFLGGDFVDVTSIITDAKQDPHSYEATARDQLAIAEAELVIYNGGGYDEFIPTLLAAAEGEPHVIEIVNGEHAHESESEAHADHDHANEHVWYDIELVRVAAEHIANDISSLRPDSLQTVTANYDLFISELDNLQLRLDALRDRSIGMGMIAVEGVGNLMLEHAGFVDQTPEELTNAIEEDREVPAAALKDAKLLIENKLVSIVIVNLQQQDSVTDQLIASAEKAGVPVVALSELIPDPTWDYLDWMANNVDKLQEAIY